MKKITCILSIIFTMLGLHASAFSGYVIAVENSIVYIDLTSNEVAVGDELSVFADNANAPTSTLKVIKAGANYSECEAIPAFSINRIVPGMKVDSGATTEQSLQTGTNTAVTSGTNDNVNQPQLSDGKVRVMIGPTNVNDIVGIGYFGTYVADMLQEQLLLCDNVVLVDPTLYRTINETTGFQINHNFDINSVKYLLQVTMQKPSTYNVANKVPIASIMSAVSSATGTNIGAQYASDVEVANLKSEVVVSVSVLDISTGERKFITRSQGTAQGKSQLKLEQGALNGLKINDGMQGFTQTVTGQAIQKAFNNIGRDLNKFFSGEATSSVMGMGFRGDDRLTVRGRSIYRGVEKLDDEDIKTLFADNPKYYFDYKSAKKQTNIVGNTMIVVGSIPLAIGLVAFCCIPPDEADMAMIGSFIGGGAAIVTGGIIYKKVKCNRRLNKIVDSYNRGLDAKNTSLSKSYGFELEYGLLNSGLGCRLIF